MLIAKLKYDFERYRLFYRQEKARKHYRQNIQRAFKEGKSSSQEIQALKADDFEYSFAKDEMDFLITNYMFMLARKLILPIPEYNEEKMWRESRYFGKVLSENGITKLRTAIRNEKKERLESILPVITAMTGLIGAIIGLIALLKD